jgi:hypothetical protein
MSLRIKRPKEVRVSRRNGRSSALDLAARKVTFQVIRRAVATLAQHLGSVKGVQRLLRHEEPTLAAEVYMEQIPESVRRTVNSIYKELRKRRPGALSRGFLRPARTDQT